MSEHSLASSSHTSPTYDMEEETTSDDESITSTTSDRHGQPQVRTLNNVSIPLLIDSSEEVTDSWHQ